MTSRAEIVLVTGGGSGIGMGLATAFHRRGAKVILAGRTRDRLDAVAAQHPGMEVEDLDVSSAQSIAAAALRIGQRHPYLTDLVNNAGVQALIDFNAGPVSTDLLSAEIDTNLRGVVLVTNAFLPLLKPAASPRIINIGSGLAYVPLVAAPLYSATKAAVHSFSLSLRMQMRGSGVRVVEVIPPVVETELHRNQPKRPPNAMPLQRFVDETMRGLDQGREEIAVGRARVLRLGSRIAPTFFSRVVNAARGQTMLPTANGEREADFYRGTNSKPVKDPVAELER